MGVEGGDGLVVGGWGVMETPACGTVVLFALFGG